MPDDQFEDAEKTREDWEEKKAYLESIGHLVVIWGCHWKRLLAEMTEYPETKLGRVLQQNETEDDVIAAIKADEVFGFVVADVITDDDVIQKWEKDGFLFPPCIQHMQLGMEHLSPFMAQQYQNANKEPKSTVVQSYNAKQVLLMTEMVKLYLEQGIQVKNISKVMQYQPGKALAPFVEKVTSMRIAAKEEKDEPKGTTAKLMGNSGKFHTV